MNFIAFRRFHLHFFLCIIAFYSFNSSARVVLPSIFGNHMVMQQQAEVTIWGWASPMEEVSIISSWDQQEVKMKATNYGKWMLKVNTPKAGGPHSLTIKGYNTIVIEDILIGEVWLGSGQSNMQWSISAGINRKDQAIAAADNDQIRLFHVVRRSAEHPQLDVVGNWEVCSKSSVMEFSAIAYFFGQELNKNLQIPIGLIHSSWGGTPAETWINSNYIAGDEKLVAAAKTNKPVPWCPEKPGVAYNAMIAPLIPFNIAGVIWYQGESNTGNPQAYNYVLSELIKSWREEWNKDFSFYFVQIAPYKYGVPMQCSLLQEAQSKTMSIPKTGMVVINDIGNIEDIHPRNKYDVGIRLAKWALAKDYGMDIKYAGPVYKEMKISGKKITLSFDHAEDGLMTKGKDKLALFQIAGEDRKFVEAKAKIDGNTVTVWSSAIKQPKAVRYAWFNTAEGELFNKSGLPASSFRTDNWEIELVSKE